MKVNAPPASFFITNENFLLIVFDNQSILKIIRALDVSKSHGRNDIFVRMTNVCDSSLLRSLSIVLGNCINFFLIWKESNAIPIHKLIVNN